MAEERRRMDAKLAGRYQDMLYRIAFSNLRNRADAEDAVQETFLRYMRSEPDFQSGEHEKAWMIRTVIHVCTDIMKNAWNKRTVGLTEGTGRERVYMPFPEEDDTLEIVLKLPEHYRNALYLFYYEDYSIHEIARILHEKESTVKTRLRRGREEVRKVLSEGRDTDESRRAAEYGAE